MSNKQDRLLKRGRPVNSARAKAKAAAMMADKPRMIRINFDLDLDCHLRLKVLAAREGAPVSRLMRKAIEELLNAGDEDEA